jgi:hypothetical protein
MLVCTVLLPLVSGLLRARTHRTNATIQELALRARQRVARPWSVQEVCHIAFSYLPAPDLCPIGADMFTKDTLLAEIPEFAKLRTAQQEAFKNTPHCCMGTNHQFAVYAAVRHTKPKAIIESGVAAGHGTWLLRQLVGPDVPIFSLDPVGPDVQYPPGDHGSFQGYRDPTPTTTYFTDAEFQDFAKVDWGTLIPDPAVRAQTFVLLDDHQSSVERMKIVRKWGFKWVFYEDNYAFPLATMPDDRTCGNLPAMPRVSGDVNFVETRGDCYSMNAVCASMTPGIPAVLHKDKFGYECSLLTPAQHLANVQYMQQSLEAYYEFPALWTPCPGSPRAPLLTPAQLTQFGLPEASGPTTFGGDIWTYVSFHPSLAVVKPDVPVR